MNKLKVHEPVMVNEVLHFLQLNRFSKTKKKVVVDATVGAGGHAIELIKKGFFVLGIDADKEMLAIAEKNLKKACPVPVSHRDQCFKLLHGNFRKIDSLIGDQVKSELIGIYFDLGVSSYHFDKSSRGFSYKDPNALLDMRLEGNKNALKASDLLNSLRKEQLQMLFREVVGYKLANKISAEVIKKREITLFSKVADFLEVLEKVNMGTSHIHSATKPFMALRMAVNSELENLKEALPRAFEKLNTGGRLVIISFHSGEDRIVKEIFKGFEEKSDGKIITKKAIKPSQKEIAVNARSRSAKLRAIEKL